MDTEDGHIFVKNLAYFVRTHEKALANALQLKRQAPKNAETSNMTTGDPSAGSSNTYSHTATPASSTSSTLAAALSLGTLNFASQNIKPAKLTLTPHHLFYLLSRFEELEIPVGPMTVRLENIHTDTLPGNYVSFLSQSQSSKRRSDRDSIHSVSSVGSVMSGMSLLWSSIGLGPSSSAAKTEKAKAEIQGDLKYLYSAFTKVPCLKLSSDRKARLIKGYEEFPFDTTVPLLAFKNISALEITEVDFRQFFGWDKLAEQLRTLTVKRAKVEDPTDLLVGIVLDDMDKRRRRSSKAPTSPVQTLQASGPSMQQCQDAKPNSLPGSPRAEELLGHSASPQAAKLMRRVSEGSRTQYRTRPRSNSPSRPNSSRQGSSYRHTRHGGYKAKRSGSGSSNSSDQSIPPYCFGSSSNFLLAGVLPASKWRFLRHLSLADNSLTSMSLSCLAPLADTLHSLDLSSNHFSEIPDCLATLTTLRALNLSNCMIDSLHSLLRSPLPAITALNLRGNRLISIAGVERLLSLERLDLRDNKLFDPTEIARLTGIPDIHEIWVASNPFTRTHGSYRITIFNLFRTTPGHREDVVIDSAGPGYSERKQLIDRMPEPEAVPVVKPDPDIEIEPTLNLDDAIIRTVDNGGLLQEPSKSRPSLVTTQSEIVVGSNRRRKGPRRRLVELSEEETPLVVHALPPVSTPPAAPTASIADINNLGTSPDHMSPQTKSALLPQPRIDALLSAPSLRSALDLAPSGPMPLPQAQDWTMSGEAYRRKIETLKSEVGNGWLNVLSEEGWESQRDLLLKRQGVGFGHGSVIRPGSNRPKAVSQGIVSGTRTLG
ncbi:MAG: hypothetical protein M1830_010675 [Pleopsidium flavum]|nr:MAG: hypothetical protein M1830_010675 [Pleopsidium flavum]